MATYSSDRRKLLKILGAIGSTCAYPFASEELYGQEAHAAHEMKAPAEPVNAAAEHFFGKADFAMITRIADLIIPSTDTPGAAAVGVPDFIDRVVSRSADHQSVMADGLRWLDGESQRSGGRRFLELSEKQQLALLEPLCAAYDANHENPARNVQFFSLMKNLTADGYYTSRAGLFDELGYKWHISANGYGACNGEPATKNS